MRSPTFSLLIVLAAASACRAGAPTPAASVAATPPTTAVAGAAATPVSSRPEDPRSLGDCPVFPPDNEWNRDISKDPVDERSDRYLAAMNAGSAKLHPDFSRDRRYGIPWISVSGKQPRVAISFEWLDESDRGPYPFPPNAPIEGDGSPDGDRHVIVIDRDACKLYEAFSCMFESPAWKCASGAIFDLRSNKRRPDGWTSADAAGLPIFAGLVRHDEVMRGEIKHALRFTVRHTRRAYVAPATHHAGKSDDPNLPPMGLRVRLKADYELPGANGTVKVILAAMKKYGMFLADNGSDWFVTGEWNPAWDDDELRALKKVPASAFEVVKHGPVRR
jgi:hypothetical protein